MTQPPHDPAPQDQPSPDDPPRPGPAQAPPPYPPPYPGYPGYPGYPPYSPPLNTYAILSLVLGLAVFPPLGIYFGYKAKEQIARTGERGIELANVGVIVGWVFTALLGVFVLIWCGMAMILVGGFAGAAS